MQYQRLPETAKRLNADRRKAYALASAIQEKQWMPRPQALRKAWAQLRREKSHGR